MLGFVVEWPPEDDNAQGLHVETVKEGSPAQAAGLAVGDVVVAVRGTPIGGIRAYLFWQLVRATEGETVAVELGDGRTLEIVATSWTW